MNFSGIRTITTSGTHSITSADNGKLIVCDEGCTFDLDPANSLGSPFFCVVKKRVQSSAPVYFQPASGEMFDGAPMGVLAITEEPMQIASDGVTVMALNDWRQNEVNSHRTVTVDACSGGSYSVALKDFGREIRVSTAAAGGLPGQSLGLYLPPSSQIVSPGYRGRKIAFRRVDNGFETNGWTVTVFAYSGEAINQSSSFGLNGLNTYAEVYMTSGQSWMWGVSNGWGA
jgi:hypothetical protein